MARKFYQLNCTRLSRSIDDLLWKLRQEADAATSFCEMSSRAVRAHDDVAVSVRSLYDALEAAIADGDRYDEEILTLTRRVRCSRLPGSRLSYTLSLEANVAGSQAPTVISDSGPWQ